MSEDSASFIAPDGTPLAGLVQSGGEDVWALRFLDEANPAEIDYQDDGPGNPEWETVELLGHPVYQDRNGGRWFAHHLIPAGSLPLSGDLIVLMRQEVRLASSCTAAIVLSAELRDLNGHGSLPYVDAMVERLRQEVAEAKQKVQAAKR